MPFISFVAGYLYREMKLIKELIEVNKKLEHEVKKTKEQVLDVGVKDICKLNHEILDGVHYFYLDADSTFVAQGRTLNDAAQHYTVVQGRDIIGWFMHMELNKKYCFVNNECMEFLDEQH
jgi:hypothetical protein